MRFVPVAIAAILAVTTYGSPLPNNATHSECTLDVYPIHNVRSIHDVPKIEPSPKIGAYSLQARNASFEPTPV